MRFCSLICEKAAAYTFLSDNSIKTLYKAYDILRFNNMAILLSNKLNYGACWNDLYIRATRSNAAGSMIA
jgi:hypothetical protein